MERLNVVALLGAMQQLERNVTISLMYSGLRLSHFRLLDTIDGDNATTVSELSLRLHVTRASASAMVSELCRSGILAMEENPADRRSYFVRLTSHGRGKLQVARSDLGVLLEQLSQRYPVEMIRHLNAFAAGAAPAPDD